MNLATIYDLKENNPIGIICSDHESGDIAYFSKDSNLLSCLDIITNNPLYFFSHHNINNTVMIKKEEISTIDSFYLLALNYSLPPKWKIIDIKPVVGDIEDIISEYSKEVYDLGDDKNE